MDGNRRIGPKVVPSQTGIECLAIYGFADKGPYNAFRVNGQLALKPYPLVKRYLRTQIDAAGDGLNLVVIDAGGLDEPYLHAATMNAVLEAQEKRATEVTIAYQLVFDDEAGAFRVQEAAM